MSQTLFRVQQKIIFQKILCTYLIFSSLLIGKALNTSLIILIHHHNFIANINILFQIIFFKYMSKQNLRKNSSTKASLPGLDRRQTRDDPNASQPKLSYTSEQSEVIKKIQSKLKLRKKSANINRQQKLINTPPEGSSDLSSTGNLSNQYIGQTPLCRNTNFYDTTLNIPMMVERFFQKQQELKHKISILNINIEHIKESLTRESTFLLCQVNKGRKIEQILGQKVNSLVQNYKSKRKIEQKEKSILNMMDQRIKKLMIMQKPLVH